MWDKLVHPIQWEINKKHKNELMETTKQARNGISKEGSWALKEGYNTSSDVISPTQTHQKSSKRIGSNSSKPKKPWEEAEHKLKYRTNKWKHRRSLVLNNYEVERWGGRKDFSIGVAFVFFKESDMKNFHLKYSMKSDMNDSYVSKCISEHDER